MWQKSVFTIALCLPFASTAFAGPLNPPSGPITSTGRTLSEIFEKASDAEPRVALSVTNTPGDADSVFRITQPGSYYLTGNVAGVVGKSGIEIDLASGGVVTLDLKGHSVQGVAGSLSGIRTIAGHLNVRDGAIRGWGGAAFSSGGGFTATDVVIESDSALGCMELLPAASAVTRTLRHCTITTTEGPAVGPHAAYPMTIDGCTLRGEGCSTSSFMWFCFDFFHRSTIVVASSTFSGPVLNWDPAGHVEGLSLSLSGVQAASAFKMGDRLEVVGASISADNCVFSTAVVDVTGSDVGSWGLSIKCTGTTTAPVALRVVGNAYSAWPDDWEMPWILAPGVPVGIDVLGSNCSLSGDSKDAAVINNVPAGGTGIRLTGSSNTVKGFRVAGSGAGGVTGVQINAGSLNNIVVNNEFVRLGGGAAVNNLGGASNGVGPVATAANLGAATNPLVNIAH